MKKQELSTNRGQAERSERVTLKHDDSVIVKSPEVVVLWNKFGSEFGSSIAVQTIRGQLLGYFEAVFKHLKIFSLDCITCLEL